MEKGNYNDAQKGISGLRKAEKVSSIVYNYLDIF